MTSSSRARQGSRWGQLVKVAACCFLVYLAYRSPKHIEVVGIGLLTLSAAIATPDLLALLSPSSAIKSQGAASSAAAVTGAVAEAESDTGRFAKTIAFVARNQIVLVGCFFLGTGLSVWAFGNAIKTIDTERTLELALPGFSLLWLALVGMVLVGWVERRVDRTNGDEVEAYVTSALGASRRLVPVFVASALFLLGTLVQIGATFHR